MDKVAMAKADVAMDTVITSNPTYQEAYLYKARINNTIDKDDVAVTAYQKYVEVVTTKGAEELEKNKTKIIESYNNIAAIYANTDKVKALEYFNKTLALDPANKYALDSMKILK